MGTFLKSKIIALLTALILIIALCSCNSLGMKPVDTETSGKLKNYMSENEKSKSGKLKNYMSENEKSKIVIKDKITLLNKAYCYGLEYELNEDAVLVFEAKSFSELEKALKEQDIKANYIEYLDFSIDEFDDFISNLKDNFNGKSDGETVYISIANPLYAYEKEIFVLNKWEYNYDDVAAIADYIKEISIYDESLDSTYIIHVTLPPDYDETKTYPMFMMTDGVWRFGAHPALRQMMSDGEVQDVILVSIGYDFTIDGMNDEARARVFCAENELFLNFITNKLMPYLSELYNIDFGHTALYGHSLGGTFTHYAVFNSDKYENQPFYYYIVGSPAWWSPLFLRDDNSKMYKTDYGYFERNKTLNKSIYVVGGENEDSDYAEFYTDNDNDSTLEGMAKFMERMNANGVTTVESEIYEGANHYDFMPAMFKEFFLMHYSI